MSHRRKPDRDTPWTLAQALAWICWRIDRVERDFGGEEGAKRWRGAMMYGIQFVLPGAVELGRVTTHETHDEGGDLDHRRLVEAIEPVRLKRIEYPPRNDDHASHELLKALREGSISAIGLRAGCTPAVRIPAAEWDGLTLTSDLRALDRARAEYSAIRVNKAEVLAAFPPRSLKSLSAVAQERRATEWLTAETRRPKPPGTTIDDLWERSPVALGPRARNRVWGRVKPKAHPSWGKPGPAARS